jgi:hypothetical protein
VYNKKRDSTMATQYTEEFEGLFKRTISVGGQSVTATGKVINGVPMIGTFYTPKEE